MSGAQPTSTEPSANTIESSEFFSMSHSPNTVGIEARRQTLAQQAIVAKPSSGTEAITDAIGGHRDLASAGLAPRDAMGLLHCARFDGVHGTR
jgi:hypothetical protein